MLSAMSGHWRHTDEPLKVFAMMQLAGVPIARLTGSVPGWIGLGETLPGGVFRDWARWSRSPDYFFADPTLDAAAKFSSVKTPILAVRPTDDKWGTARAEDALLVHYSNAPITRRTVTPTEAGGPIGHLGFFRSRYARTLWPPVIEWLKSSD
jgi:predicted alpha/beta hydrolase